MVPKSSSARTQLRKIGARVLSEANDLKRTSEALAKDMAVDHALVRSVIEGSADLATTRDFLWRMADAFPISVSDIWIEADDTDAGVRVMTKAQSEASSRIFERRLGDQTLSPYYEYRDTAMSRLAPFKPEWIRELRVVDDADPDNTDVAFNRGHLLHQTTFFIGPVNFYWEIAGRRHCQEMNTGDSNYITPLVPHSFASRDASQPTIIIAVTYGGQVRRCLDDFGLVETEGVDRFAGNLRNDDVLARRLERHLAAESLSQEYLAESLREAGAEAGRAASLAQGRTLPTPRECALMAEFLNITPRDLQVSGLDEGEEVVVRHHADTRSRGYPAGNRRAYDMWELARCRHQPFLKGFEVRVLDTPDVDRGFHHGLHEYVFNYGSQAVRLGWADDRSALLESGDSAYIRAFVPHRFTNAEAGSVPSSEAAGGRLVVVRIPGNLTDSALDEYAAFPTEGRERVAEETKQWF